MTIWAVGIVVFCVAGLVQGCTGFGMALVAAPCLMLLMPPVTAVCTIVLMSTVNTFFVAMHARRHIRVRLVGPLALGGVMGIPFGIWTLQVVDPPLIKVLVGAFVMAFALLLLSGWRRPLEHPRWSLIPVGMASGLLGGSTSMGGPPVILFLANQETPKDAFRGNISCYFFTVNCFGIAMFLAKGLLEAQVALQAAVFLPAMLLGTYGGVALAKRVPEGLFRKVVMIGVALMGLVLLATNVRGAL